MDSATYFIRKGGSFMTKRKSYTDSEKKMIQKDEDLTQKGKVSDQVTPPWAVNPKGKSGARDMGHRNRP
jgi:hypothetical protein